MARSAVRSMTEGPPFKLVISFTLPLMFGFLFQQLYSFVDTAIVGKYLGSAALAAVGSTGSLNFLILGFCMGCCSGFAIPVAQAFGAGDETELRRCVMHCVYISAIISIVMGVVTAVLTPWMLRLTQTPEDIIAGATAYIQPIFAAIPATVLYNMASGIMRSLGDSKTPVYFLALASLVNILLDLLFILVFHMGVAGAAYATIVSQIVSGVGCLIVLIKKFPILHPRPGDTALSLPLALRMLGMGAPMGLQYSITAIGSVVMQTAVNGLGTVAVAAMTAGGKLYSFFTCVIDSLATTMATFAGQNIGARKLQRVHEGLKASSTIGGVYCIVALIAMIFFGKPLLSLFVNATETDVIHLAYHYMVICTACFIPLMFVNLLRFSIQGMGFTRVAMIAGVMELVARVGVALLLVPFFGFYGACWGNPVAWFFADAFLFPCYFHITKKLHFRMYPAGDNN